MRQDHRPKPPEGAVAVLLVDVLPEVAKSVAADLRKIGRRDLAEQVPHLRIYGRCPCGSPSCGTFYCVPNDATSKYHGTTVGNVTVVNGHITQVETFSSEVDGVLDQYFPR